MCVAFFASVLHCVCHFNRSFCARANTQTTLERTEYNAARYRRLQNCVLLLKERVQELLGDKRARIRGFELSDTHAVSGRL